MNRLLSSLVRIFAGAGLFAILYSFIVTERIDVFREVEKEVIRVRATLMKIDVHEWIAGQDNWAAFGTFSFEANGLPHTAEGDLAPDHKRRGRRRTSRTQAESYQAGWTIGQSYDAFWNPTHPESIFFRLITSRELLETSAKFRIAGGILIALSIGIAVISTRRKRLSPSSS